MPERNEMETSASTAQFRAFANRTPANESSEEWADDAPRHRTAIIAVVIGLILVVGIVVLFVR